MAFITIPQGASYFEFNRKSDCLLMCNRATFTIGRWGILALQYGHNRQDCAQVKQMEFPQAPHMQGLRSVPSNSSVHIEHSGAFALLLAFLRTAMGPPPSPLRCLLTGVWGARISSTT